MRSFDLIILGGGSAAFAAAIKATELGASVAVCERDVIGGTCLNRGCVPSKSLLAAAEIVHEAKHPRFEGLGLTEGGLDLVAVMHQKDRLLDALREEKYASVLKKHPKISYFPASARFVGPHEVRVGDETLHGEKFIIATGATPTPPPVPGADAIDYLTSRSALSLQKLPESMIVIGGRSVAMELGQLYSRLGTRVTVLQRSLRILPEEELEISDLLAELLRREGMEIHTGVALKTFSQSGTTKNVRAEIGGETLSFSAPAILMATGSRPNTRDLDLDVPGVKTDAQGAILVDETLQTSAPHVWAAGDVLAKKMLVTTAAREGSIAAQNAVDPCCRNAMDYSSVPHAVFTDPNVASVGLTESLARAKGFEMDARILPLALVPKVRAIYKSDGLIKMVIEKPTGKILGVHILAPLAAEVIHTAALMIEHGLTVQDAIKKIDVYPTLSETIKLVALSFSKDPAALSCCAE